VAFGSFTFDAARGSFLVIPRTVAGRRNGVAWVTTITAAGPGNAATKEVASAPAAEPGRGGNSLTAAQRERAVAAAVKQIRAGRLRKVVLARDLQVTTQAPINVPGALTAKTRLISLSPAAICAG